MQLVDSIPGFNVASALQKHKLLPFSPVSRGYPVSCCYCRFINKENYNFCTNCGYPLQPAKEFLDKFYVRQQARRKSQRNFRLKIEYARNALYVLAACSMMGFFYVFSAVKQTVTTGFVMVLLGIIYAALGRWSLTRPFTALLISLIILLTFTIINTWAELSSAFSTTGGIFLFMIQLILIHFLLQGVKGAFRADILEEEFKV